MKSTHISLPKVIIFYGPPGSGKNTQAEKLALRYPNYKVLDYGSILRDYVRDNRDLKDEKGTIARRIEEKISNGSVVITDDLMFVAGHQLTHLLETGKSVILVGPGRAKDEVVWLARFLKQHAIHSYVFHLHVSLEDVVYRLANRHFVPGSHLPYPSYQEALKHTPAGTTPIRRQDDTDVNRIVHRYHSQYKDQFASILFIFQLYAESQVFVIDGMQSVEDVHKDVTKIIDTYYTGV